MKFSFGKERKLITFIIKISPPTEKKTRLDAISHDKKAQIPMCTPLMWRLSLVHPASHQPARNPNTKPAAKKNQSFASLPRLTALCPLTALR